MKLTKHGRIIGRENNVVRVDFGREADPPAPTFPGANGLRPVEKEVASIGPPIRLCAADLHRLTHHLKRLPA
jgi:hypothetical protein